MIKTIGHCNRPIGHFVDLLKSAGVEAVVDRRRTRAAPAFRPRALDADPIGRRRTPIAMMARRCAGGQRVITRWPDGRTSRGRSSDWSRACPITTLCLMCAEKERSTAIASCWRHGSWLNPGRYGAPAGPTVSASYAVRWGELSRLATTVRRISSLPLKIAAYGLPGRTRSANGQWSAP